MPRLHHTIRLDELADDGVWVLLLSVRYFHLRLLIHGVCSTYYLSINASVNLLIYNMFAGCLKHDRNRNPKRITVSFGNISDLLHLLSMTF